MITIAGLDFEGGFPLNTTVFNEVSGVYVVYAFPSNMVLDVGETEQLKTRMTNHERKPDWIRHAQNNSVHVAVFREVNQMRRLALESNLRSRLNPPCGDR